MLPLGMLLGAGRVCAADVLDELVRAYESEDADRFADLVAQRATDPWFDVDDLITRDQRPVARAYAALVDGPDREALAAYAERGGKPPESDRSAYDRALAHAQRKDPAGVLAALKDTDVARGCALLPRVAILLGPAWYRAGDYRAASQWFEIGAREARALGWLRMELAALKGARRVSHVRGDRGGEMRTMERLLELLGMIGQEQMAARVQADLAGLLWQGGDSARSVPLLAQAHGVFARAGAHADAGIAAMNASLILAKRGELAVALDWLRVAEEHHKHFSDLRARVRFALIRAALNTETGEYKSAVADLQSVMHELPDEARRERADLLAQIAFAQLQDGSFGEALANLDEAWGLLKDGEDPTAVANVLKLKAAVFRSQGKPVEALGTLEKILGDLEGDSIGAGHAYLEMARAYRDCKSHAKALVVLETALNRFRDADAHDFLADAEQVRAEIHAGDGQWEFAFEHASRSLDHLDDVVTGLPDESMARTRQRRAGAFVTGFHAAWAAERSDRAVSILERWRARALLDALGGRQRLRGIGLPKALAAQERDAAAALTLAYARRAEHRAAGRWKESRASVKVIRAARSRLQAVKRRAQRTAKQITGLKFPDPLGVESIQAALRPAEALVYLSRHEKDLVSLIVTSSRVVRHRLCTVAEASAALASFEEAREEDGPDAQRALTKLERALVPNLVLPKGTKHVILCPEGELCYVPWSALLPPTQETACTPSGTVLAALREQRAGPGTGILAVGNPAYGERASSSVPMYFRGRKLTPLPGSEVEVRRIAKAKEDVLLLGKDATEQGLRNALPGRTRWRAVLLSCHGLIDVSYPSLSALALSAHENDDGFLTVFEILDMPVPADLIVASACDSGRGPVVRGEGVIGFARAFMIAGSPRVVVSLWKADDEATAELMTRFFDLLRGGASTASALRAAQMFVRDHPDHDEWRHPRYWAGWLLWGLGS